MVQKQMWFFPVTPRASLLAGGKMTVGGPSSWDVAGKCSESKEDGDRFRSTVGMEGIIKGKGKGYLSAKSGVVDIVGEKAKKKLG